MLFLVSTEIFLRLKECNDFMKIIAYSIFIAVTYLNSFKKYSQGRNYEGKIDKWEKFAGNCMLSLQKPFLPSIQN